MRSRTVLGIGHEKPTTRRRRTVTAKGRDTIHEPQSLLRGDRGDHHPILGVGLAEQASIIGEGFSRFQGTAMHSLAAFGIIIAKRAISVAALVIGEIGRASCRERGCQYV